MTGFYPIFPRFLNWYGICNDVIIMTSIINELLNIDRAYQDETNLVKSSDDVYTVEFELAGYSKKDLKITVCDEILKIEAEKSGKKKKTHRVYLKNLVSLDSISSKMSEGLLTRHAPSGIRAMRRRALLSSWPMAS